MHSTTSHTLCAHVYIVVYTQSIKSIHPEQQQPPPTRRDLKKKEENQEFCLLIAVWRWQMHTASPPFSCTYISWCSLWKRKKENPLLIQFVVFLPPSPQLASRMFWRKKRIYIVSRASHTVVPISLVVCVCVHTQSHPSVYYFTRKDSKGSA